MKKRTTPEASAKAIGYTRVSTLEQAREGVSLDAQAQAVRNYCALRGLELLEIVTDEGVSAATPLADRPGGCRVVSALRGGHAGHLVSYKLDRVFRDTSDCLNMTRQWDRLGASLHLVDMGGASLDTSSAMGRFFMTVLAGAAEMERNLIGERTAMALAHKAAKGEFTGGGCPYGFEVDAGGVLVQIEAEQKVLAAARVLRESGLSLRAVSAELDRLGFRSRSGVPFQAVQIRRMVGEG